MHTLNLFTFNLVLLPVIAVGFFVGWWLLEKERSWKTKTAALTLPYIPLAVLNYIFYSDIYIIALFWTAYL